MAANDRQHGGDHWQGSAYQYWDFAADLKMLYHSGNAGKYIFRWRKKNGIEDLEKCVHFLEKCIELELNMLPVMNRDRLFWKFAIENKMHLIDGAILFYIMEGQWAEAKAMAEVLLAAENGADV